jgi:ubiquitin C-terminal hydrolase
MMLQAEIVDVPGVRDIVYYDSKRETGLVGLRNQGATCYMNSLLQVGTTKAPTAHYESLFS